MFDSWRIALLTIAALAASAPGVRGQAITPKPIPAGLGYPVPAATINQWISTNNDTAERGHAWDVWAGLTAASGEKYHDADLPIWETWLGTEDLFPAANAPVNLTAAMAGPRTLRAFVAPRQFHHDAATLKRLGAGQGSETQVVSFNKFDPAAAAFIVAPQSGPGGQTFAYNKQAGLQALNAAWPTGTSGSARGVNDFPVGALELKPVLSLVKATGLTPQPLWRGIAGSTNAANPTPTTWTTCVLVDPDGQGGIRPATKAEIAKAGTVSGLACKSYLYGPLSLLYSFTLTAEEAKAFTAAQGTPAQAGDHAVLVGMHVNTKEIPNWTWQTFWWQPGQNAPNDFPGSKKGQPASLPEPWKNYASCHAYAQTKTAGGKAMQICFNPYLETSPGIPVGVTSNCVSCHGVARVLADESNESYPAAYKAPIGLFTDKLYFNSLSTHTDFSWALPSDAQ